MRKNKLTISTFLVSALGLIFSMKAFIYILENFVANAIGENSIKVDQSDLNIALIVVLSLLFIRLMFVFWQYKSNRITSEALENQTIPNLDTYQCAKCGKDVSEKVKSYCLERPEKFKGKVYCYDHQHR